MAFASIRAISSNQPSEIPSWRRLMSGGGGVRDFADQLSAGEIDAVAGRCDSQVTVRAAHAADARATSKQPRAEAAARPASSSQRRSTSHGAASASYRLALTFARAEWQAKLAITAIAANARLPKISSSQWGKTSDIRHATLAAMLPIVFAWPKNTKSASREEISAPCKCGGHEKLGWRTAGVYPRIKPRIIKPGVRAGADQLSHRKIFAARMWGIAQLKNNKAIEPAMKRIGGVVILCA